MKQYFILMVGESPFQRLHAIHIIADSARACMENMMKSPDYSGHFMELIAVTVDGIGTVVGTHTIGVYEPIRGFKETFSVEF